MATTPIRLPNRPLSQARVVGGGATWTRTDTDWNEIGHIDHFSISNSELLFRYFVVGWSVGWKRKRRDLPTDPARSL